MAGRGSRPVARFKDLEVTIPQWRMLELFAPIWDYYKADVCHFNTRIGLERRGWAEFKWVQGVLMARLTPAGMEIRDAIHTRRARAKAREYGERPEER
jgi:hypothetical protein